MDVLFASWQQWFVHAEAAVCLLAAPDEGIRRRRGLGAYLGGAIAVTIY